MQKHVIVKTGLLAESFVANGAAKRPVFRVFMRVIPQVARRGKGLWTGGTLMRFHLAKKKTHHFKYKLIHAFLSERR